MEIKARKKLTASLWTSLPGSTQYRRYEGLNLRSVFNQSKKSIQVIKKI